MRDWESWVIRVGMGWGWGGELGNICILFKKNLVVFVSHRKLRISSSFAERSERIDLNLNGLSSWEANRKSEKLFCYVKNEVLPYS